MLISILSRGLMRCLNVSNVCRRLPCLQGSPCAELVRRFRVSGSGGWASLHASANEVELEAGERGEVGHTRRCSLLPMSGSNLREI